MFFSSFWYIICQFLSSITPRKVSLIFEIECSWCSCVFRRKILIFGRRLRSVNSGYAWLIPLERVWREELVGMFKSYVGFPERGHRSLKETRRRRGFQAFSGHLVACFLKLKAWWSCGEIREEIWRVWRVSGQWWRFPASSKAAAMAAGGDWGRWWWNFNFTTHLLQYYKSTPQSFWFCKSNPARSFQN